MKNGDKRLSYAQIKRIVFSLDLLNCQSCDLPYILEETLSRFYLKCSLAVFSPDSGGDLSCPGASQSLCFMWQKNQTYTENWECALFDVNRKGTSGVVNWVATVTTPICHSLCCCCRDGILAAMLLIWSFMTSHTRYAYDVWNSNGMQLVFHHGNNSKNKWHFYFFFCS